MSLEPLPKETTDEIREILEGCRDGRLNHNQEVYHCGTAHCIAGWKAVMDYAKAKRSDRITRADFDRAPAYSERLDTFIRKQQNTWLEWDYAYRAWELTHREADLLFDSAATLPGQFELLEALERGERFE